MAVAVLPVRIPCVTIVITIGCGYVQALFKAMRYFEEWGEWMHLFDRDIRFEAQSAGIYNGNISGDWSINGTPNGGYLVAIATAGLLQSSHKNQTPVLTANFISRCGPGQADLSTWEIACSKQFCRMEARLIQQGREKMRMLATFADEIDNCLLRRYEQAPPDMLPPEECVQFPKIPGYTLYDNADVRLDPSCAGWMENRLSPVSEIKGWFSFKKPRPYDYCSVALAADAFPPAVLASQGMVAWVPTLEISINIRNVPRTRWLKCRFVTRFINCGLLEEDGEIWDEAGELVAISRQIAQLRQAVS